MDPLQDFRIILMYLVLNNATLSTVSSREAEMTFVNNYTLVQGHILFFPMPLLGHITSCEQCCE